MLAAAISGWEPGEVAGAAQDELHQGHRRHHGWQLARQADVSAIRGSGYVVHSLEAAIWSVARSLSFEDAVLTAANLGEDADTTAAIAGQLAGALYGVSGIPAAWREKLAWHDRIVGYAEALLPEGIRDAR